MYVPGGWQKSWLPGQGTNSKAHSSVQVDIVLDKQTVYGA